MILKSCLEDATGDFFEALIKGTPEAKNSALHVSIRFQMNWYEPTEHSICKLFHFIYFSPSNYTKVYFRESEFAECQSEGVYELVADHDSCWREAWDIAKRRADVMIGEELANGFIRKAMHDHVRIDRISVIKLDHFELDSRHRNFELKKIDLTHHLVKV